MTAEAIATQVLNLRDAELLILRVPSTFGFSEMADLRRQLSGLVPEEVRRRAAIVVLSGAMQLDALTDADLKRAGLQCVKEGA